MKFTAFAVAALATVASVASATDYQPALRALAVSEPAAPDTNTLAASPTERQSSSVEAAAAAAAGKDAAEIVDADGKKSKEWGGGIGWGRPWGGFGWGGYGGGWGGYGGGWGW